MDLNRLGLFRSISQRVDWLTRRQGVLATNIANSDTPDYVPQDLQPFQAQLRQAGLGGKLKPRVTQAGHIAGSGAARTAGAAEMADPYEMKPSGNAVNVEQQMTLVAETAMDHQLALNLYRKHLGMEFRTALGRNGR